MCKQVIKCQLDVPRTTERYVPLKQGTTVAAIAATKRSIRTVRATWTECVASYRLIMVCTLHKQPQPIPCKARHKCGGHRCYEEAMLGSAH